MKIQGFEYQLPSWAKCYIFNGTKDNLTNEEIEKIDYFLQQEDKELNQDGDFSHGHWGTPSEDYHSGYNDITGNSEGAMVFDVEYVAFF